MLYAIYAYEHTYGGLHGMNYSAVVECDSMEEADEIGFEMALDVIDSYTCIREDIEERASELQEEGLFDWDWDEAVEAIAEQRTEWEIFEVLDTKGKSQTELENEFYNNKEEFIKTYC